MPVFPGGGIDRRRGAAAVSAQRRRGAIGRFELKRIILGGLRRPYGVGERVQLKVCPLTAAEDLAYLDITHGDGVVRRGIAKLEAQRQLLTAVGWRGKLGAELCIRTSGNAQPGSLAVAIAVFCAALVADDLKVIDRFGGVHCQRHAIFGIGFRGHAGPDKEPGAPDTASVACRGSGQRGGSAGGGGRLLDAVAVLLPHIAVGAGGIGHLTRGLIDRRQLLHAEIAQRDRVARGGVGVAELQPEGQRSVRDVRRHDAFHMIRAARRQAAPVKSAVGVLIIAVEAGLVLSLIAGGHEVIADSIGAARLQLHTGIGVEPDLPDAPPFGRCFGDAQRGAVRGFAEVHHIAVVMPLKHRVSPTVGELSQRYVPVVGGLDHGIGLAVENLLVQSKAGRELVRVLVDDLLDAHVAHRHIGILRRAAE